MPDPAPEKKPSADEKVAPKAVRDVQNAFEAGQITSLDDIPKDPETGLPSFTEYEKAVDDANQAVDDARSDS